MWPRDGLRQLVGIEHPILLAPMAGPGTAELAIAVSEAGGLGSLPCAMLSPEEIKAQVQVIQQRTSRPFNLNFFCHKPPKVDAQRGDAWKSRLAPYYREFGLDPSAPVPGCQPHAVCRNPLRVDRGVEARRRQLSLRSAGRAAARSCQDGGVQGPILGDDRSGSALAGSARRRRYHCPRD